MATVSNHSSSIEVTNLDRRPSLNSIQAGMRRRIPHHLGIVAGLIDEIGLVEQINELVGEQPGEKVSPGHAVKAMILNGLGLLIEYKEQQSTERGMRFLKDPMFLADSVFLKSPERIQALTLIMGLCLLIYNLGQRELRSTLIRRGKTVKNQLSRETHSPTLRWIFQQFQAIHLLTIKGENEISNLTQERLNLLQFFPKPCQQYYLLV